MGSTSGDLYERETLRTRYACTNDAPRKAHTQLELLPQRSSLWEANGEITQGRIAERKPSPLNLFSTLPNTGSSSTNYVLGEKARKFRFFLQLGRALESRHEGCKTKSRKRKAKRKGQRSCMTTRNPIWGARIGEL